MNGHRFSLAFMVHIMRNLSIQVEDFKQSVIFDIISVILINVSVP
jgi:hypothetical protein